MVTAINTSISQMNQSFHSISTRLHKNKNKILKELGKIDSFERKSLVNIVHSETGNIQRKYATFVMNLNDTVNFDFFVVTMWHLSTHLNNSISSPSSMKNSVFSNVTEMQESETIFNFLVFLKTLELLQPAELKPLNLTELLSDQRFEKYVSLLQ